MDLGILVVGLRYTRGAIALLRSGEKKRIAALTDLKSQIESTAAATEDNKQQAPLYMCTEFSAMSACSIVSFFFLVETDVEQLRAPNCTCIW